MCGGPEAFNRRLDVETLRGPQSGARPKESSNAILQKKGKLFMNRSKRRKVLEGGGNQTQRDDTAFEERSTAESNLQQRAKAVSSLRSATALQDASAESAVHGYGPRLFSGVETFRDPVERPVPKTLPHPGPLPLGEGEFCADGCNDERVGSWPQGNLVKDRGLSVNLYGFSVGFSRRWPDRMSK
jgi:hypothetical protein